MRKVKLKTYEWVVYGLTDTEGNIVYVGKTGNASSRLRGHINAARKKCNTSKVCLWVQGLLFKGSKPGIIILEKCLGEDHAYSVEAMWIKSLRNKGVDLKNCNSGGSGIKSGFQMTKEHVQFLKKKRPESWRKNISSALMGHDVSEKNRARSSEEQRRFSVDQVIEIRKLRETGLSYNKIASQFGVDQVTIFNVIKGKKRCYAI